MKLIAALLAATAISCAYAESKSPFPADLPAHPEKFCLVAGVISAGVMEKINVGYPVEVVYDDVNKLSQRELSVFMNESVTLAMQFADHSDLPIPPKQFAQWNYDRCITAMAPRDPEVFEMVGGKLQKAQ